MYDPACGSGGMFVQSAAFVAGHQKVAGDELSCFGQEKTADTVRLAKMNLAVHGLQGDIKEGNSYYDDIHQSAGNLIFLWLIFQKFEAWMMLVTVFTITLINIITLLDLATITWS